MKPLSVRQQYISCAVLLSAACLAVVWAVPFPPMQDYPQHLFLALVNATYTDPARNWPQFYEATLSIGPYSLFYFLAAGLAKAVSITTAGKIVLSAYQLLLLLVALRLPGPDREHPPWGALLILASSFNQMYFMGFTNYLLSLPLLLLAMDDFHRLARAFRLRNLARHLIIIGLIFLCHPYSFLVYIVLAGATALLFERGQGIRALVVPIGAAVLFAAWFAGARPTGDTGRMPLLWWPAADTIGYFLLPFSNMNISSGMDWPAAAPWLLVAAICGCTITSGLRHGRRPLADSRALVCLLMVGAGFFALPFWVGKYSYFNLRLAAPTLFFAGAALGTMPVRRGAGLAICGLCAIIIFQSWQVQAKVSRETAEIVPLSRKMRPNAKVLPMMFNTASAVLDPKFFPEAHAHDFFYYHLLQGGGANPNLFPSPMLPVRFKKGVALPLATHGFSWQEQGRFYDYILTRDQPAGFSPFIRRYARSLGSSGRWALYEAPQGQR